MDRISTMNVSKKAPPPSTHRTRRRIFNSCEDALLMQLVSQFGEQAWPIIASGIPDRTARQCKERYFTYLCPSVRVVPWTPAEDALLAEKVRDFGQRWTVISRFFEGRTPNALKNRWNACLKAGTVKAKDPPPQSRSLLPPISSLPFVESAFRSSLDEQMKESANPRA
jgi:hypothetical protein